MKEDIDLAAEAYPCCQCIHWKMYQCEYELDEIGYECEEFRIPSIDEAYEKIYEEILIEFTPNYIRKNIF